MLDSEPDVRVEAYKKLMDLGATLEDLQDTKMRMVIIKEGISDPDTRVVQQCLNFLKPLVLEKSKK